MQAGLTKRSMILEDITGLSLTHINEALKISAYKKKLQHYTQLVKALVFKAFFHACL